MAKYQDLFVAYQKSELPTEGGFIVSSFFDEESTYTRYEAISYSNVKDMYPSETGLTFQAEGAKVFILVEPRNYSKKHVEPAHRDTNYAIPYRFSEVEVHNSQRQDRIMIGKEPVMTYASFTILKPTGSNFAYIFYASEDLLSGLHTFFQESLRKDARIPMRDARQATDIFMDVFQKIIVAKPGE
ncbi:MAG: hypothetical protein ACOCRN_00510 [Spirochaetia bacterium]